MQQFLNDLLGTFYDIDHSLRLYATEIEVVRAQTITSLKVASPDLASEEYLNTTLLVYGDGIPGATDTKTLQSGTQSDLLHRLKSPAGNKNVIGKMIIVTIFNYWDDYIRSTLAKLLKIEKDDIKCDLFGDLRHIRNSIIHNKSIAMNGVGKNKLLKWFNKGELVVIEEKHLIFLKESFKRIELYFTEGALSDSIKKELFD